jgi:hypothetical protein
MTRLYKYIPFNPLPIEGALDGFAEAGMMEAGTYSSDEHNYANIPFNSLPIEPALDVVFPRFGSEPMPNLNRTRTGPRTGPHVRVGFISSK